MAHTCAWAAAWGRRTAWGAAALLACRAAGGGFDLFQTDTRSTAMGGASVGLAADAGTVYDNPANMVMLPGLETLAGAILVAPTATQNLGPNGSYTLDDQVFPLPHAYATWQADDRWWLGLGAFSRFGLGTRYDRDWPGQFTAQRPPLRPSASTRAWPAAWRCAASSMAASGCASTGWRLSRGFCVTRDAEQNNGEGWTNASEYVMMFLLDNGCG
jgi:hypothetical protein